MSSAGEAMIKQVDEAAADLTSLAGMALETAARLGAQEARVSTAASWQKRLVVEAGQFTLANSLASRSIGIVVHVDGKKGSATLNSTDAATVRQAVADAVALARFSVADPALTLATRADAPPAAPLSFMFDPGLAGLTHAELQAMMREGLAVLTRDKRVALDRFESQVDVSWHGYANSLGVAQAERQTQVTWGFFGMAREGDEVTGFDYENNTSFSHGNLLARCVTDAERFAAKIVGQLHPRACPSYRGPVLFSPRAVLEIIAPMILYHAGGRQIMDGKSRWDKAVGTAVASEWLTLADRPHDARFAGATAFDGDGLPTRDQKILDRGVLRTHLHDCYSAKRCQTRSTATAGGPFAMAFAPGKESLAAMAGHRPRLLMIDRFSGNSDPLKGDFSGVAKSSRLFESGNDAGAVTETMVAGNFFDLAPRILAASDRLEVISSHAEAPYLLVDDVSVTGTEK